MARSKRASGGGADTTREAVEILRRCEHLVGKIQMLKYYTSEPSGVQNPELERLYKAALGAAGLRPIKFVECNRALRAILRGRSDRYYPDIELELLWERLLTGSDDGVLEEARAAFDVLQRYVVLYAHRFAVWSGPILRDGMSVREGRQNGREKKTETLGDLTERQVAEYLEICEEHPNFGKSGAIAEMRRRHAEKDPKTGSWKHERGYSVRRLQRVLPRARPDKK